MENKWEAMSISRIKTEVEALNEEARLLTCAELMNDPRKGVVAFAQKHCVRMSALCMNVRAWRSSGALRTRRTHRDIGRSSARDEVGRGPLAGPVVAAAVVLPRGVEILGINDSKKLSEKRREALAEEIKRKRWLIRLLRYRRRRSIVSISCMRLSAR